MSRATVMNMRATLRAGLRTGERDLPVGPVVVIIVRERPRKRAHADPVALREQGERAEQRGAYGAAAGYYLRALDTYPEDLKPGMRKQMTELRRRVVLCEQKQVLQHQGRWARRAA
jgi:hypothetical protein